ncbi:MAG TPA: DUF1585 domain-containing protein [Kofleriaceae bacterium]|nr:DUF1585 domain-containing protein [Kofleriaceae bacterium]
MRWWLLILASLAIARDSRADRSLAEYRYLRALSIDLAGRPPTRDELAALEQPGFSFDAWIAAHLGGPAYAERLRRVYMDLLRLEVGPAFTFVPNAVALRRQEIVGPDGAPMYVYFRRGQRRVDVATDGELCLTADETGQQFPANAPPIGTGKPIAQAALDARTVKVTPWWLYADYRAAVPSDRVAPDWARRFPGFTPVPGLQLEPDGKTAVQQVRVCREEAQAALTGTVYASGRPGAKKGDPPPAGRLTLPPGDSGFAKSHRGRAVSCLSGTGFSSSVECGCGIGLERCLPAAGSGNEPPAFVLPSHTPLGSDAPFESTPQPAAAWERLWWSEEAKHFLDKIFLEDRDFREVLTGRATAVNGPLAQFYRFFAGATCCGATADLGYADPAPLVEPGAIPDALVPEDTATWLAVADRGPHAAGLLTMPIFLTKYGSRRARAHVAYSAFLCRDFVADAVKLAPSDEPDLTRRPGCAACHQTLEPMAAYFTRVMESDWTYLPAETFPMSHPQCSKAKGAPGACKAIYDPAFATLRGAYASVAHAEAGPAGLAAELTASPAFAPCVVDNVAQALLGRPLAAEDQAWKAGLAKRFVDGGYRMRALVGAIVTSARYRDGNDARRR